MEMKELAKELLEKIAKNNKVESTDDVYFGMARIRSSEGNKILGDFVVITEQEYNSLCQDHQFLEALQAAGVDNWEGYEAARESMDE